VGKKASSRNEPILQKKELPLAELKIGGFTRLSTCDWPGELVATIFCQGCPWSCGYCHNPHLIPANGLSEVHWPDVLAFLHKRRGLLDGVVFSGGEPTLQKELLQAIRTARDLGFRTGLHTGGPYPERFAILLPFLDWVGFDIKAPYKQYQDITGAKGSGAKAFESLRLLLASGVDYEIRTTIHPALLDSEAIALLKEEISKLGVTNHKIQNFRPTGCISAHLLDTAQDYK
jgi:pyruvate formate lyase activating enzyme